MAFPNAVCHFSHLKALCTPFHAWQDKCETCNQLKANHKLFKQYEEVKYSSRTP